MRYSRHPNDAECHPPMWRPAYESSPPGERLAHLEAAVQHLRDNDQRQREINSSFKSRLNSLEQAQRRSQELARLKASRKAARKDVIKTVQWAISIVASVAYIAHLVISGQWLALLRFVLGFDS